MSETRRIENYGIMKLSPVERGSNNLRIQTDVIQLPYSEYLNVRSNPPKGHYGFACLMDGEYVIDIIDIQFRRQILIDKDRYLVQLAWQEFCNSKTIANQLGAPLPDTTVDYPIWNCKEIRFKLEPGVILNVFKSNIIPVTCSGSGISEPNLGGEPPGLPPQPTLPPPPNVPDSEKLPLSPPYEGDDDNGNTYKRGEAEPPPSGSPGPDCTKCYNISFTVNGTDRDGNSFNDSGVAQLCGEITGFDSFFNPAFGSWAYRALVKSCSGTLTPSNLYGTTNATSLSGSATVTEAP